MLCKKYYQFTNWRHQFQDRHWFFNWNYLMIWRWQKSELGVFLAYQNNNFWIFYNSVAQWKVALQHNIIHISIKLKWTSLETKKLSSLDLIEEYSEYSIKIFARINVKFALSPPRYSPGIPIWVEKYGHKIFPKFELFGFFRN